LKDGAVRDRDTEIGDTDDDGLNGDDGEGDSLQGYIKRGWP